MDTRGEWYGRQALALVLLLSGAVTTLRAENWPGFRGPTGQGISHEKNLPIKWAPTENVVWKRSVPGQGWSSPIVWEDRIYVTSATDGGKSLHVLCLARDTGAVIWDKAVPQKAGHKLRQNSYATPTPCTDGQHVYVLAADGQVIAFSREGDVVWVNSEFDYYSQHGVAVSPVVCGDLVIVAFDWSSRGPDKKVGWQIPWDQSFIMAVDRATGKRQWTGKRGSSRIAHVTPLIVTVDGEDQLVSSAGDVIQGFGVETGRLLWTASNPGEGVVPSLAVSDGVVFATSGFGDSAIRAVRLGGRGDVTNTHVLWVREDDVPKVPSLLCVGPRLYTLTESGVLTCIEAATGQDVWRQRLAGKFSASPVWADGKLYLVGENGKTTIIREGPKFEVVAENELEGTFCATPAISQGRIHLRSDTTLYCVGR